MYNVDYFCTFYYDLNIKTCRNIPSPFISVTVVELCLPEKAAKKSCSSSPRCIDLELISLPTDQEMKRLFLKT